MAYVVMEADETVIGPFKTKQQAIDWLDKHSLAGEVLKLNNPKTHRNAEAEALRKVLDAEDRKRTPAGQKALRQYARKAGLL